MKRVLQALVIALIAALALPTAAHADGVVPVGSSPVLIGFGHMCANFGADPESCLNPHNGVFSNGQSIDVSAENDNIAEFRVGFVRRSDPCEPFTCGSGCNTRYDGKPVVVLEWNASPAFGVRDYTASNDQLKISSTADDNNLWVQSGFWFINVGATNHAGVDCGTGDPMILTNRPNTGTVWSRCGGCWDAAKQNWKLV